MTGNREEFTLDDYSRELFSSKYQLRVLQAVGRHAVEPFEPFSIARIKGDLERRDVKLGANVIRREVTRLISLDLVTCMQPDATAFHDYSYACTPSPSWPRWITLLESWDRPPEKQLVLFE